MMRSRTIAQVQADLDALEAAADRAGLALGCVFSSYDEYVADSVCSRRASRAEEPPARIHSQLLTTMATLTLAGVFLLV